MRALTLMSTTFVMVISGFTGGCSSDGTGEFQGTLPTVNGPLCTQTVNKLRGCGLLTEGVVECNEPTGGELDCTIGCVNRAPCNQIADAFCGQQGPTAECVLACQQANAFTCGDGTTVPGDWVCDGDEDCDDAADELNCTDAPQEPQFQCGDGTSIPDYWQCDGGEDCDDGSDEVGCPEPQLFTCTNGDVVSLDDRCDGGEDCEDGSDEVGCPKRAEFVCPDGSTPFGFGDD